MDFWQQQRYARRQTTLYLVGFFIMTIFVAVLAEMALRHFLPDYNEESKFPLMGVSFVVLTVGVAAFNYAMYASQGGSYVAESVGARQVNPATNNPAERQLLNIVEEVAVASSLPVPPVYIINAEAINAFAAGIKPDNAVIAVTVGALQTLSRDELQGVIAHEFGHIRNGDMKISMRLAALLMGFFIAMYVGIRILQFAPRSQEGNGRRGGNPIIAIALLLMLAGVVTYFAGSILRAAVSRQREYLADASSVQFTRNPDALIGALKKIEKESVHDTPQGAGAYAHLYFDHRSMWDILFATHPPLKKRIAALEGDE
jgi:heat shock protein HtpX